MQTHWLPLGIAKTEGKSEYESCAVFWISKGMRKVISELLMLLLEMVLSVALVGYLRTNWLLVVMLWLCHNFWSLILSLKSLLVKSKLPHPTCELGRKGNLHSLSIIFPGHRTGRCTSEPFPCPLLPSVSGLSPFAGAVPWGGVRLCYLLLSSLNWGAATAAIASHCFQAPSCFCCGRAHCHLNFSFFYALLAADIWAL